MKYLKEYLSFLKENTNSLELTPQVVKNLDQEAKKAGVDLKDEETLAAIVKDITDQIDIDDPNPKLKINFNAQKIQENIISNRDSLYKINESSGEPTGTLDTVIKILEYFFTSGELSETASHDVLGHVGHHAHHPTEEEIEETKKTLLKNQSGIIKFLKAIATILKSVATVLIKCTLGLFDRIIIWVCRNVLFMKVSTSAQAGWIGVAVIAVALFIFGLTHVGSEVVGAISAVALSNLLISFFALVKAKIIVFSHLFHSIYGIFRTIKTSKKAKGEEEEVTILEFADVIEDLLKRTFNVGNKEKLSSFKIMDPITAEDEILPKYFRADIDSEKLEINLFTKTSHILKLKNIITHFNKETTEHLSDYFTEIINKKDYEKIAEIPYFKQAMVEYTGKPITSEDLNRGGNIFSNFLGLGISKFEKWVQHIHGEAIYKEDEEFITNIVDPELERLKKKGVEPSVDINKIQEYSELFYKRMKGFYNSLDKEFIEKSIKNEADWKLIFYGFGLKNGKNLIWWLNNELPTERTEFREADTTLIKKHLKRLGYENIEDDWKYFTKNKDKLVRDSE